MKTIISIGSVIKKILTENTNLNKKLKGQIYPIIAPINTEFPFITYERNSNIKENKDRIDDNAQVIIYVMSDRYDEGIEIAEMVREIMKVSNQVINGFNVHKIKLLSTNENANDEGYIQQLIFSIQLTN